MITSTILLVAQASTAGAPSAQNLANLSLPQAAIVYDQCLARAAARASRTDAAATAIYDIAKAQCAETRAALLTGHNGDKQRNMLLDSIDTEKKLSFPSLTVAVRLRREQYEQQHSTTPK